MIVYAENPKEKNFFSGTNKQVQQSHEIQKSILLIYTSNEQLETQILNAIPFIITQEIEILKCKTNKTYPGPIYKTLMKNSKKI